MSTEEQEMMARISQLAGQINRHKNQRAGIASHAAPHQAHYNCMRSPRDRRPPTDWPQAHNHASGSWHHGTAPYPSRGRVAKSVHRNRSLVLNGASLPPPRPSPATDESPVPESPGNSWITKSDRHLQLINSSVYERETQSRTKAIEETIKQKQRQKDSRERNKLMHHLGQNANGSAVVTNGQPAVKYEIELQGIRFQVVKNGSKLVKLAGDTNSPKATPKVALVGGVRFFRSRNGNMYRQGVVKAQRQSGTVKKVDVPCKPFSTTGSCPKGPLCRYQHDPSKVAVCRDMLQRGNCLGATACDLSHDLTDQRTPTCLHYLRGNCTNSSCVYTHNDVSSEGLVCRDFGIYGYCDKGAQCTDRHVFECPDFSNTGICKTKGCKLPHRERASVLRRAKPADMTDAMDEDDVSSDEDGESVDSDDVDSDQVDEFVGPDGSPDLDLELQQDFIKL